VDAPSLARGHAPVSYRKQLLPRERLPREKRSLVSSLSLSLSLAGAYLLNVLLNLAILHPAAVARSLRRYFSDTSLIPPLPPLRRYNHELIFLAFREEEASALRGMFRTFRLFVCVCVCARVPSERDNSISITFTMHKVSRASRSRFFPCLLPAASPDTGISSLPPHPLVAFSVSLREQLSARAPRRGAILIIIFLYNSRNFSSLLSLSLSLSLSLIRAFIQRKHVTSRYPPRPESFPSE